MARVSTAWPINEYRLVAAGLMAAGCVPARGVAEVGAVCGELGVPVVVVESLGSGSIWSATILKKLSTSGSVFFAGSKPSLSLKAVERNDTVWSSDAIVRADVATMC